MTRWVTCSIKKALLADPTISSFDLQVETRNGTVQLTGFVNNQSQIASAAEGASGVKNELMVKQ